MKTQKIIKLLNFCSPDAVTNVKIQKYYQNEPRFNGVLSRDDLPNKAKDGTL